MNRQTDRNSKKVIVGFRHLKRIYLKDISSMYCFMKVENERKLLLIMVRQTGKKKNLSTGNIPFYLIQV